MNIQIKTGMLFNHKYYKHMYREAFPMLHRT